MTTHKDGRLEHKRQLNINGSVQGTYSLMENTDDENLVQMMRQS